MLGHIIRKEILDHILSLRFFILSAIGALVIWLSLYSGHTYYRTWLEDYRVAQTASEERIRQIMVAGDHVPLPWEEFTSISYLVHKPPTPLSIFVRGLEPNLGQSIPVQGYRGNKRLKMSPVASEPILGVFPVLDLRLIVQVVLSLFVLLLTHDAVCGEKEAGTLRLTASFPVPKDRLLLGKLVGALIPSMMAFGVPLMLGTAAVLLMPDVAFTNAELMRLGWIVVVFVIYLMAFTCVGLFASSVTHRVATSFVILLAFWTASVVVVPRLSLIVAEVFKPAPSNHEYQAEAALIDAEVMEKRNELQAKWLKAHGLPGQEWWRTPEGWEARWLYHNKTRTLGEEFAATRRSRLKETFNNRYSARLGLAVVLARLSPAFAMKNAVIRLAGTGLDRQQRFKLAYDRHQAQDLAWYYKASTLRRLRSAYPAKYGEPRWDVSDMPRFSYRDIWPKEEVRAALVDAGILALWGLFFFVGAYVAMLRYDLR